MRLGEPLHFQKMAIVIIKNINTESAITPCKPNATKMKSPNSKTIKNENGTIVTNLNIAGQ